MRPGGFEPPTIGLEGRRSSPELRARNSRVAAPRRLSRPAEQFLGNVARGSLLASPGGCARRSQLGACTACPGAAAARAVDPADCRVPRQRLAALGARTARDGDSFPGRLQSGLPAPYGALVHLTLRRKCPHQRRPTLHTPSCNAFCSGVGGYASAQRGVIRGASSARVVGALGLHVGALRGASTSCAVKPRLVPRWPSIGSLRTPAEGGRSSVGLVLCVRCARIGA